MNKEFKRSLVYILIWSSVWVFLISTITWSMGRAYVVLDRIWPDLITISIISLCNVNILLPKLYFRGMKWKYVASLVIFILICMTLMSQIDFINTLPFANPENSNLPIHGPFRLMRAQMASSPSSNIIRWMVWLPPMFICAFGTTSLELAHYANTKEQQALQLEREKLQTELKFLKAQMNPHFLFNALNNIYTLVLTNNEIASEKLLQLSQMLRYMVYDSNVDLIPINQEIEYLKNFIDLMQLKDSSGLNIDLKIEITQSHMMIPPILFIPFIENAFKHSNFENKESGWVKIYIHDQSEGVILDVKNSKASKNIQTDHLGGVGLENIKQRLALQYGENYHLHIDDLATEYHVSLNIPYHEND